MFPKCNFSLVFFRNCKYIVIIIFSTSSLNIIIYDNFNNKSFQVGVRFNQSDKRTNLPFQFLAACRLVSIFNDRLFLVVECALSFIWDELRYAITIFLARKACRSLTFSHFLKFTFNVSSNFHCQFKFFTLHSCFIF